jgi:hypothetical protein
MDPPPRGGVNAMSILRTMFDRIDLVGGLVFEEPRVARFLVVPSSANGLTVPEDPSFPVSDRHIDGIHAPGVAPGSYAVIFYRTNHTGTPRFSVRLNATRLTQQTLSTAGPHTWHEIVPPGALRPSDNQLTLAVGGEGTVTFSDIVILYTSRELTIEQPAVLAPF